MRRALIVVCLALTIAVAVVAIKGIITHNHKDSVSASGMQMAAAAQAGNAGSSKHTGVAIAAEMAGSDCGEKIKNADVQLRGVSGIIQVTGDCGNSINIPITVGNGHSLQFIHGGTYVLNQPITLNDNSSLVGLPIASDDGPLKLVEANGANLPYMIRMAGHTTLQNIYLSGVGLQNPKGLDVVLVDNANRIHIHDVTICCATRDNIHVTSDLGKDNSSGDGYLGPDVELARSGRDAMFIERQGDWIIGPQVEFEGSGRDGLHGEDTATLRCSNCDFGSNLRYGVFAGVVNAPEITKVNSSGWIIVGSQFGNNHQGDFYATGSAYKGRLEYAGLHTITGNALTNINSKSTGNTYNSITFVDAGGDTVTGNTWGFFQPAWHPTYKYIVSDTFSLLSGNQRYPSVIAGNNMISGSYASGPFLLAPVDTASGNSAGNNK
jgi:hypothetical protein